MRNDIFNQKQLKTKNNVQSEIYIKFTDLFFSSKREIFTLMKNFMYVFGSIFSAFIIININAEKFSLGNQIAPKIFHFWLIITFCILFQYIVLIFDYQMADLIADTKLILKRLFNLEKKMVNTNFFFDFDCDYEYVGFFFRLIINLCLLFFGYIILAQLLINAKLYNIYLNLGVGATEILILYNCFRNIKSIIFTNFAKNRHKIRLINNLKLKKTQIHIKRMKILLTIIKIKVRILIYLLILFKSFFKNKQKIIFIRKRISRLLCTKRKVIEFLNQVTKVDIPELQNLIDSEIKKAKEDIFSKRMIPEFTKLKKCLIKENDRLKKYCEIISKEKWCKFKIVK